MFHLAKMILKYPEIENTVCSEWDYFVYYSIRFVQTPMP